VGKIGICDFDELQISNLHRQILFSHADIGKSKAELAAKCIKETNPFIQTQIHSEKFSIENAEKIVKEYNLILDCTDNFFAKYLLNDCAVLFKIPFASASIYQLEGQMKSYRPGESSCLRCLWPQVPDQNCGGVCATVGVLGMVPGVLGILQALEAIKIILNLEGALKNEMLIFDFSAYRMRTIKIEKDPACPVCAKNSWIKRISPENYLNLQNTDLDISNLKPRELFDYEIFDVREPQEAKERPVDVIKCHQAPSSHFDDYISQFERNKKYLLFCEKGMRSSRLTKLLRGHGIDQAFSIANGVSALNDFLRKNKDLLKNG